MKIMNLLLPRKLWISEEDLKVCGNGTLIQLLSQACLELGHPVFNSLDFAATILCIYVPQ
jgi:hypothetical protein